MRRIYPIEGMNASNIVHMILAVNLYNIEQNCRMDVLLLRLASSHSGLSAARDHSIALLACSRRLSAGCALLKEGRIG